MKLVFPKPASNEPSAAANSFATRVVRSTTRSKAPVFTLGSARSGTTLLYHTLLSAGGFAVLRSETHAFNVLEPAYGNWRVPTNRKKFVDAWLKTRMFKISGLDESEIRAMLMAECNDGGDFLRLFLGEIARKQAAERWAECTPDHLLYIERIKQTIPDALIIHIIRDGRDVALSLEKQKWIRPFPWDADRRLDVAALHWEWAVQRGREAGRKLGADYCEISFEQLVLDPRPVLAHLSDFIRQDLNYDRIREAAIGSVAHPNSSFQNGQRAGEFNPIGRWKEALPSEQIRTLEALVGDTLRELGYSTSDLEINTADRRQFARLRDRYNRYFDLKLWLKKKPRVGKFLVNKELDWL
jgi:LPS sulfotransferase NodH